VDFPRTFRGPWISPAGAKPHHIGALLQAPEDLALAAEQGWADRATVERTGAGWHAWGERPDAFYCQTTLAALGWKDSAPG
jgi:hypothetical protein